MTLVTFQNLPSTSTPLSAQNLNNNFAYTTPVGGIQAYAGSTAPNGYLICDGQAISRTTYADLFSVIGTTYGTGDGSTTFNVPNLKGKVIAGYDSTQTEFDNLGETGGEKTHTLSTNEIPSHYHSITGVPEGTASGTTKQAILYKYTDATTYIATTQSSGSGQAHNILQPYMTLNYIIKY